MLYYFELFSEDGGPFEIREDSEEVVLLKLKSAYGDELQVVYTEDFKIIYEGAINQ